MVYHDSRYLGRYNEIDQRDIMMHYQMLSVGKRNKQIGLCRGVGGGQMWMEINIGQRMNNVRTEELLETEPKVIAVACNFCMTMIDDVKAKDKADDVQVLDLAELLAQRVLKISTKRWLKGQSPPMNRRPSRRCPANSGIVYGPVQRPLHFGPDRSDGLPVTLKISG